MSNHRHKCPHCGGRLKIRNSTAQHPLLRTVWLRCESEACGFSAAARFEITHELSPSGMPRPGISLPPAPSAIRREALSTYRSAYDERQIDLVDLLEQA